MRHLAALLTLLLAVNARAEDLAEGVAAGRWQASAGATARDSRLAVSGEHSVRLDATADAGLRRPLPPADLRGRDALVFTAFWLTYAPGGLPPGQPSVVLRCPGGGWVLYTRRGAVENAAWKALRVPLAGGGDWPRRDNGGCGDLSRVEALDLYFRAPTGNQPYRVYVDDVEFTASTSSGDDGGDAPLVLKILGVVYDPIIEARGGRLHQVYGGFDPEAVLRRAAEKMKQNSQGTVDFRLVDVRVLDAWPRLRDGFRYTDATFDAAFTARRPASLAQFDYRALFAENGIEARVNRGEVDEVWLVTGNTDYFRTWESNMVGPGAYYLNSGPTTDVPVNRAVAVMGLNFQHGDGDDIGHAYGHRVEDVMSRIYGGWDRTNPGTNAWSAFASTDAEMPGRAAVGNIHIPVNGRDHYDYDNPRGVRSTADDWLNYPNLTGAQTVVSSANWRRGGDAHIEYLDWWYARLPHAPGRGPDGKLANWWFYIVQLDRFKNGDRGQ